MFLTVHLTDILHKPILGNKNYDDAYYCRYCAYIYQVRWTKYKKLEDMIFQCDSWINSIFSNKNIYLLDLFLNKCYTYGFFMLIKS